MSNSKRKREAEARRAEREKTVSYLGTRRVETLRGPVKDCRGLATPQGAFQWDRSIAIHIEEGQGGTNRVPSRMSFQQGKGFKDTPVTPRSKKVKGGVPNFAPVTHPAAPQLEGVLRPDHRSAPSNTFGVKAPEAAPKFVLKPRGYEGQGFNGIQSFRNSEPQKVAFATPSMPKVEKVYPPAEGIKQKV